MVKIYRDKTFFDQANKTIDIPEVGGTLELYFHPGKKLITLTFKTVEGKVKYTLPGGELHNAVNSCFLDPGLTNPVGEHQVHVFSDSDQESAAGEFGFEEGSD